MNILELPCLGRPFSLGMLYDCRSDKLIPGITLWDDHTLAKAKNSRPQISTDYEVISQDSFGNKSVHLGIEANLKLSVLGGLVTVDGSAKYLNDRRSSSNQARVTLKFQTSTKFERLGMDQLGNVQHPRIFDDDTATHVVTGVQYGADAFFVFDRQVTKEEKFTDVHGKLEATVTGIPALKVSGHGQVDINDAVKSEVSQFQCKFYGDFLLPENPSTFEEAVKVYKDLPKLLGENSKKVIAKKVWLYPLSKLDSKAKQIVRDVSAELISQVEKLMEDMHKLRIQSNDISNSETVAKFEDFQEQMSEFSRMLDAYRMKVTKQLAVLLPKVRGGGAEESKLAEIIQNDKKSPYSYRSLSMWLGKKEREIKRLNAMMENLEGIEFADSLGDLDTYIYGAEFTYVLCFAFNVIQNQDSHLDKMSAYLSTGSNPTAQGARSHPLWYENRKVMSELMTHLNKFKEFAKANKDRDGVKFVAIDRSEADIDGSEQGPTILLYDNGVSTQFTPPNAPPGKPWCLSASQNNIQLQWAPPNEGKESITNYVVHYRSVQSSDWKVLQLGLQDKATVCDLVPDSIYVFKVLPESKAGCGPGSELSDPIQTAKAEQRSAEVVRDMCGVPIECGPLNIYQIPLEQVMKVKLGDSGALRQDLYIAKYVFGEPPLGKKLKERILMVVGATGAGKTTLINGFANYMYGVKWEDKFRFKLISDEGNKAKTRSQTSDISAYTLYPTKDSRVSYTLTLIDTPGFGDVSGIERDKVIVKQVEHFFRMDPPNGIDTLHGIGFVTKATDERLTITQKYIFHSILAIYGKDIEGNIFLMTTFCDGARKPLVIEAATAAEVPFQDYFKFNNSALYHEGSADSPFDTMYWKLGMASYEEFFKKFEKAQPKTLILTKEVLREREQLETFIQGLQEEVTPGLIEIDILKQKEKALKLHQDSIHSKKGSFTFRYDRIKIAKVDLPPRHYVTNCLTCNRTCHDDCAFNYKDDKYKCSAMDNGGPSNARCRICPGNCSWRQHVNNPYKFVLTREKKIETFEDLKKEFGSAGSASDDDVTTRTEKQAALKRVESEIDKLERNGRLVEYMINNMNAELERRQRNVFENLRKARVCQENIRKKALKANPLTDEQYIDLMITSEKQEKGEGFLERIKILEKLKEKARLVNKVQNVQPQSLPKDKKWWQIWR